jgi:hypothetical protein
MHIVEKGLEWLIEHMSKMILKLLSSLDIYEFIGNFCENIKISFIIPIKSIAKIISRVLDL